MSNFGKHPDFLVRSASPYNGGPPLGLLREAFVTPNELFFVRNHGNVPQVDPAHYRLSIGGLVKRPFALSLDELRQNFPKRTLTATLQCAGNRREELIEVAPIPDELPWGEEAISNAAWAGAALRDVLGEGPAGIAPEARHVAFAGLDDVQRQGKTFGFGSSIPIEKALGPEVLLAYEMNGEPLPPAHGFPVRAIVPGYIGARSVKWLAAVTLQTAPSDNYFQAHAYQLFPPQASAETADWSSGLQLGELPVNAVICCPGAGEQLTGPAWVRGYALAGGGRRIARLDLSTDNGETWITANLSEEESQWAWRFWEARLDLPPGPCQLVARAWDSAANTQPEDPRKIWNFKGYMNNTWHRVKVIVR